MVKVQYVGGSSYTEFALDGVRTGFSRGMIRDLPDSFVDTMIRPGIEHGTTMWKIIEDSKPDEKTEAMKATIEPTVEEIVEELVEETESEEAVEEVNYSSLTRAKLMSLCKERGIAVKNTSKKAELIELLSA
jgi:hypothetical protein